MPDWSYQPLLRPFLFQYPSEVARDFTLSAMGRLASVPLGPAIISNMGGMNPPESVQLTAFGITFPSPVGLSAGLDINAVAPRALQEFGYGFLELGPVTLAPVESHDKPKRRLKQQGISYPDVPVNPGLDALSARLAKYGHLKIPLGIRLSYQPGAGALQAATERVQLMQGLAPFADFFTLDCRDELANGLWSSEQWAEHLEMLKQVNEQATRPILICLRPDLDPRRVDEIVSAALRQELCGVVVTGGIAALHNRRLMGQPSHAASVQAVRFLHDEYGDQITIIGSGGIQQPQDALDFLDAGATLLQLHSGFVYSGPGLPKRTNEAIAYYCPPPQAEPLPQAKSRLNLPSWVGFALLGVGLVVSGIVVWIVAITRTVLPYDEAFVGMTRAQMIAVNPLLLPFMTHDRVTVAGTMISTGALYIGLSVYGVRRGAEWARKTLIVSALSGFLSFFTFLGFGYFDSIHALLTVGLLPLFLLGAFGKRNPPKPVNPPNVTNNRRWKISTWGQLLFVVTGLGLILGGATIITVGILHTFVPEDLEFMKTTAQALSAANPRLLPLIAHDRVGFGGNLISVGFAVLLMALWGFRQGERWVWWTLAAGGLPGFVAGLGIHIAVGYLNLWHLFPAILAVIIFVVALALAFPYLYNPEPVNRKQSPT